ncbi:hypothetical protein PIB30_017703 [Stylosanthes scabra]|nr:hypothetical protein [Stylosanthes scabra]
MYFSQAKKLVLSSPNESHEISLEPFNFELITVSPVRSLNCGGSSNKVVNFAPIGLVNMLNNGGAIQTLEFDEDKNVAEVGVRGAGEMRVFSSEIPKACKIDNEDVDFEYEDGMVVIQVPWPSSSKSSIIQYTY